jgi:hypothetical protein
MMAKAQFVLLSGLEDYIRSTLVLPPSCDREPELASLFFAQTVRETVRVLPGRLQRNRDYLFRFREGLPLHTEQGLNFLAALPDGGEVPHDFEVVSETTTMRQFCGH